MEVSGSVLRRVTYSSFSRGGGGGVRPRRVMVCSGFCDEGHLQYYSKDKGGSAVLTTKNNLKLLKAPLLDHLQGNLYSDAAEVLMKVRAEKKEMKRKMKQEKKAKRKGSKMKTVSDSESSSSESSESECDLPPASQAKMLPPPALLPETTTIAENPRAQHHAMELCSGSIGASFENEAAAAPQKRIEVCMGNKCKRSGAPALLQEFERVVGLQGGAVVGCKCMGKCKTAPNIRIHNSVVDDGLGLAQGLNDSVMIPANPLCIGVGFEDVDAIVATFFGENHKDMDMPAAVT